MLGPRRFLQTGKVYAAVLAKATEAERADMTARAVEAVKRISAQAESTPDNGGGGYASRCAWVI
jgi:hypothetical protein